MRARWLGFLIPSLCILAVFPSPAGADSASGSLERIARAHATSNVAEIMKIARELADEILTAPEAPWRVTATVVGLYRKAEALEAGVLSAEDAGKLGRLYLALSESYADEAKRYLERSVQKTNDPEERVALGNAHLYLGNAAAARREYLNVSKRRPADPVLLVNLALAERAMGDTASAYGRLRQVLRKPAPASIGRAAGLAVADIQIASKDLAGARLELLKILQKWPSDRDALRMMKQIGERK